jgi:hypothetical protein
VSRARLVNSVMKDQVFWLPGSLAVNTIALVFQLAAVPWYLDVLHRDEGLYFNPDRKLKYCILFHCNSLGFSSSLNLQEGLLVPNGISFSANGTQEPPVATAEISYVSRRSAHRGGVCPRQTRMSGRIDQKCPSRLR